MFQVSVTAFDAKQIKKTAVVFARSTGGLLPSARALNKVCGGAVEKAMKNSRFVGDAGQMLWAAGLPGAVEQVLVVGLGDAAGLTENDWRLRGVNVGTRLDERGVATAAVVLEAPGRKAGLETAAGALLEGMQLALYRFDRFKTGTKPHQKPAFRRVTMAVAGDIVQKVRKRTAGLAGLAAGTDLTRELVNLPPNIALPGAMAREARKLAPLGLKVEVLDEKRIKELGLNLMMAVGAGAAPDQQPRLILMRYAGGKKGDPFRAVVGKGVMFDTGGYNLKPTGSMETMKSDMAGAAAVMGLMKALALRKSPVNVIGVCGCVVNMVSSRAYLPSAVLESYQGLQVEIGNTDAEGRLVLADAMAYVIKRHKPAELIDLATLTGACMVALGGLYAGLFSTDDRMASALQKSGEETGERVWRLPVDDAYAARSQVADLNNNGKRYGGASTAAVFLKKFVGETPWAHLDIAGVALNEKIPEDAQFPVKGATGFGVRLLVNYLEKAGKSG
jgi:leucyl aminopeptidase